jgi:predicted ABC-type ATPase
VSLQRIEAPRFWIVAGPNGSGKSTLYDATDIEGFGRSVWIINPDLLSARLQSQEGLGAALANGEALNRIWAWLEASIRAHQTIGVETVLSTDKYRTLVEQAKARGFEIRLLYVTVKTADLNVERVRIRVARGGHDVPEPKIRERRERSFQQLPWFLDHADVALMYDNSGAVPSLIGRKLGGVIEVDPSAPADIKAAVATLAD